MMLNAELLPDSVDLDGLLPDWELNRWSIGVTIRWAAGRAIRSTRTPRAGAR